MIVMSSKYVTQQAVSTHITIKLNLNNEMYLKFHIKIDRYKQIFIFT